MQRVLQSSLAVLCTGALQESSIQQWLSDNILPPTLTQQSARRRAQRTVAQWALERQRRGRLERAILRPPPEPVTQEEVQDVGAPDSSGTDTTSSTASTSSDSDMPTGLGSVEDAADDVPGSPVSEGTVSFGDSDGLGSVGNLGEEQETLSQ